MEIEDENLETYLFLNTIPSPKRYLKMLNKIENETDF